MITFENVSHAYGRQQSVTDISFQIEGGQVVTLLGPSGCGKTTLLRLAAGFETPISGQVAQDGNILSSPTILVAPERRQMGLVFQSYALFPHMTIGENIRFGMKQTDSEAEIYLAELMQEMDLSDMETKFPHELSGGQQQRVALARALAPAPRLILLDEPYSGLDSRLRERVRDKMLHILRQTGTAALMVTHDAEEAMFMSDKIIVLRDGKIMQQGRPIDLYCRPENAFVAEFFGELNHIPARGRNGQAESMVGNFTCSGIQDGQAADVLIRYEGLQISLQETGLKARVMESRLLGGSSLLHLSMTSETDTTRELHLHARIPGLNFMAEGEIVHLDVDPAQVFVFSQLEKNATDSS